MKKRKKDSSYKDAKRRLLHFSEISLILDNYDDIFSAFDPRPYHERALSDDFLQEAKRASRDKEEGIELKLLIPKKLRNKNSEEQIKKRLRDHFKKHFNIIFKEVKQIKREGALLGFVGLMMIILAAYLSSFESSNIVMHFFVVLFEAGGWFTGWTGLDQFYYTANEKKPDLDFYRKMSKCKITFLNY